MPSNDVLKAQAIALAQALGKDATKLNLDATNDELVQLVKDLEAEKAMTPEAKADKVAEKKAKAKVAEKKAKAKVAEKKAKAFPYCIASGKAITSLRGILSDGDEVCANYVPGGQDTIDKLVESGHIVKS